ncbi:MAG: acetylornithine aminotransferase [Gemmatales bacterium]|nr:MAG: acetylornithine aminotransferase [Gemmatales bacterium]
MTKAIQHPNETRSNAIREVIAKAEPRCLRTYTPTLAVIEKSSGVFLWTPEGRRLYDYSSGVLVVNLGHHPASWMKRFVNYMGWQSNPWQEAETTYFSAPTLTAYNAITPVEAEASRRLVETMRQCPGGQRLDQVLWAASGSEAIQKALWAALARDRQRDIIIATRYGFHGKKGLAGATTGSEADRERDPRVRFISFPMAECADVSQRDDPFDASKYEQELKALKDEFGKRLNALITEPYLGGGGSYHPPKAYLQLLQKFCRDNDIVFILDEVQSNFGRTGDLFAFVTYGIEPDIVVLGKGLGNGVPVAAAVGRSDLFAHLEYGEGSDTWSANPMCCAAVLATLDEYAANDVLSHCRRSSRIIEEGLVRLKELPFVARVRGEKGGMVWGVEMTDHDRRSAADWANDFVLACYQGTPGGDGIHLLGPLAKKVVRIAPPLTISEQEAKDSVRVMFDCAARLVEAVAAKG